MKNRFLLCAPIAAAAFASPAPAQELLWLTQIGSKGVDRTVAIEQSGNGHIFVAGDTTGNLGGTFFGNYDIWVSRRDPAGGEDWIMQIGTSGNDSPSSLMSDGAGGFYLAGSTQGSLGGPNLGSDDAFVARYDADGDLLWMVQFGTSASDIASGLMRATYEDGVYVGGTTYGSLGGPNQGGSDLWVARFDADGHKLWAVQTGSVGNEGEVCLGYAIHDGVYAAGWTTGDLGGPNQGHNDAFLAHFNPGGDQDWLLQFGTETLDFVTRTGPDGIGGLITAGVTFGDLGGPQQGEGDIWLSHHTVHGELKWLTQFGTETGDVAAAVCAAGGGRSYVGGYTAGELGGPNGGSLDAWIALIEADGGVALVTQFGTPAADAVTALAGDGYGKGGFLAAGQTSGSLGAPNQGNEDAWFAHFAPPFECYPDLDLSGTLDLFDFLAFIGRFNNLDPDADCTGEGQFDLFDFLCFTNAFNEGC